MTQPDKLMIEEYWEMMKKEEPPKHIGELAALLMPMLLWNRKGKSDE